MVSIMFMRSETDGKPLIEPLKVFVRSGRNGGRDLAKCRVQRILNQRALQGRQQAAAECERHEFRGRETQAGNMLKSVEQAPAHYAVHPLAEQREARGFKRLEIAADSTRMPCQVGGNRFYELRERQPLPPRTEALQQMPLSRDLIVARHVIPSIGSVLPHARIPCHKSTFLRNPRFGITYSDRSGSNASACW